MMIGVSMIVRSKRGTKRSAFDVVMVHGHGGWSSHDVVVRLQVAAPPDIPTYDTYLTPGRLGLKFKSALSEHTELVRK